MASKSTRSKSPKTMEDLYKRVLRVKRQQIHLELPDTKALLKDSRLEKMFTLFERGEITSQNTPSENAEKMVRALEFKGYDSYKTFLLVLRDYRPSLADKLTVEGDDLLRMNSGDGPRSDNIPGCSSSESNYHPAHNYNNVVANNRGCPDDDSTDQYDDVEDAGILHFNERGPGPRYHISSIGISTRNHLAEDLNHKETFVQFCQAMQVDDHLVRVCLRSRNPTGQLLQELNSEPGATIERLGVALNQIGKPHLFESVKKLNETL